MASPSGQSARLGASDQRSAGHWQQFSNTTANEPVHAFPHHESARSSRTSTPVELKPLGASVSVQDAPRNEGHPPHRVTEQMEEGLHEFAHRVEHGLFMDDSGRYRRKAAWDRFKGKGFRKFGWLESAKNAAMSSVLNFLLLCVPGAWAVYFLNKSHKIEPSILLSLCFLSIIPLAKLFDFGGKQIRFYTGKRIGDLIIVTLNNAVESMLAIVLLLKCELRILQATIVGVILLHLLLVPGISFLTGGAKIYSQELHQHYTQLNHTLLGIGVLSLLLPAAFFSVLEDGVTDNPLTDPASVQKFTEMSRGIALTLFSVYIISRIFLHNLPRERDGSLSMHATTKDIHDEEHQVKDTEPKVNPWFLSLLLLALTVVAGITAEMFVTSVSKEHRERNDSTISEEWFGLVLVPMVSFSADAFIAVAYFLRRVLFLKPKPPQTLAEHAAIDMSIQFTLFWMPLLVMIAWWMDKPLLLLFDTYEVAVLLGASFLVNYVTADSKTNWAEGYIMVAFYFLITLCAWFYGGQSAISQMYAAACPQN